MASTNLDAFGAIITSERKPKGEITPEARAAIIAAVQAGERKSVIAARFRISPAAVDRTLQRFEKTGQLVSRPRSGRPKTKPVAEPPSEPSARVVGPVRNVRSPPGPAMASAAGNVNSNRKQQQNQHQQNQHQQNQHQLLLAADPGERSLATLLATLTTTLHPTTYVFTSLSPVSPLPPLAEIQLLFREPEGVTIVVSIDFATAQKMQYFFPCRMITLGVTSSLEAVGFMAVLAARLAARNMGVNPVSGFYHDHLFVPLGREDEAVEVLAAVAREHRDKLPPPAPPSASASTSASASVSSCAAAPSGQLPPH
ncbi:hypothetical protein CDD83_3922 [Cordyceps sp. RAO-2017]|nr:hypothetical protein CDD83_3922 [Cordyceps sp. RAO-2017]